MSKHDKRTPAQIAEDNERAAHFFTQLRALCVANRCTMHSVGFYHTPIDVQFQHKKRSYETYSFFGVGPSECGFPVEFFQPSQCVTRLDGDEEKEEKEIESDGSEQD